MMRHALPWLVLATTSAIAPLHAQQAMQSGTYPAAAGSTPPDATAAPLPMHHHTATHPAAMQGTAETTGNGNATAVPRTPIPPWTAADDAAAFPRLLQHHPMHAPALNYFVLLERLETSGPMRDDSQAWDARAWLGNDTSRLWMRSMGERLAHHTEAAALDVLYGHAISPWWDLLIGLRQDFQSPDFRPQHHRTWAAVGIQGLAPYKFETQSTLYLGKQGQAMLHLEIQYDMLISNRLILQPRIETTLALHPDTASKIETGLRLRYAFTPRFAPYLGWVHTRQYGDTAAQTAQTKARGEPARYSEFVAGLRLWF